MGPEPMTSTERRSSRLGTARPLYEGTERVELSGRIVRSGRGLRVILDAERGRVQQPDPLDHTVIEVDVADLGPAEGCVKRPGRIKIMHNEGPAVTGWRHGKPVVVAGDLYPAGGEVLDRLVDAAVPEPELVGAQAERPAEDLAAQADAEHRDARGEHLAHRGHRVPGCGRVTGAVGEEHPVRAGGQDL